jgi:hypothetical protein
MLEFDINNKKLLPNTNLFIFKATCDVKVSVDGWVITLDEVDANNLYKVGSSSDGIINIM